MPPIARALVLTLAWLSLGGCRRIVCANDTNNIVGINFGDGTGDTAVRSRTMKPGETYALGARAFNLSELCPDLVHTSWNEPELFRFSSSDSSVATISERGLVTAVKVGTATLKVWRGSTADDQFVVNVVAAAPPPAGTVK